MTLGSSTESYLNREVAGEEHIYVVNKDKLNCVEFSNFFSLLQSEKQDFITVF